jgi:hypothetical protein
LAGIVVNPGFESAFVQVRANAPADSTEIGRWVSRL